MHTLRGRSHIAGLAMWSDWAMSERAEQFADFAWEASQTSDVSAAINKIIEFSSRLLKADYAGITLLRRGRPISVGPTAEAVTRVDELQHSLREGPCVDAALEEEFHLSGDLAKDDRWPRWGPAAARLGLHSILSVTLHTEDRRLGALNVYGVELSRFTMDDLETARLFAAHASAVLAAAMAQGNLRQAVESRTRIGQAQGILMERYQIDADRAHAVLTRHSQDTNTRLRDVAETLIATGRLPETPEPSDPGTHRRARSFGQ
jgi:GAF domain-containing protein